MKKGVKTWTDKDKNKVDSTRKDIVTAGITTEHIVTGLTNILKRQLVMVSNFDKLSHSGLNAYSPPKLLLIKVERIKDRAFLIRNKRRNLNVIFLILL